MESSLWKESQDIAPEEGGNSQFITDVIKITKNSTNIDDKVEAHKREKKSNKQIERDILKNHINDGLRWV